jgi:acyl carrier protein
MNAENNILQQLVSLLSSKFEVSREFAYSHLTDPLNGEFFRFDAIDMVYFVLELKKTFDAQLDDTMLKDCTYWGIQDFARYLSNSKAPT